MKRSFLPFFFALCIACTTIFGAKVNAGITVLGQGGRNVQVFGQGIATAHCPIGLSCAIELQAGELVTDLPALSDAAHWSIEMRLRDGPNPQTVFILTPRAGAKAQSSLVILTDRRLYAINLINSADQHTPILAFDHPHQADAQMLTRINALKARVMAQRKAQAFAAKTAAEAQHCPPPANAAVAISTTSQPQTQPSLNTRAAAPKPATAQGETASRKTARAAAKPEGGIAKGFDYNFSIQGAAAFRPTRIYTDGRRTFVELPKSYDGAMPLVIGQGPASSQSFRVTMDQNQRRIVIDRALAQFSLQSGRKKLLITKG